MKGGTLSALREPLWVRYRDDIIRVAVAILACLALLWIAYESFRFARQPAQLAGRPIHPGAFDLKGLRDLSQRWFRGEPIYARFNSATYPPASYALLWPLVGWATLGATMLVWTVTAAACLAALVRISVTASGAQTRPERALIALVPLAMYATGATIGNGQITIHVMALTAATLVCLKPEGRSISRGRLAALFFLGALVKPVLSAPFYWIVLFVPGNLWPAALVVLGYAGVTVIAASFQGGGLMSLLSEWLARGVAMGATAGESNLHIWLSRLGFAWGILPASLLILGMLGAWVYRHRRGDLWILAGVTASVARFWAYHRWYDDLLLLFPLVALFRIAKTSRQDSTTGTWAGFLFAFTLASTLAPGGLYLLPDPWRQAYLLSQTVVWSGALVFLIVIARAGNDVDTLVAGLANEVNVGNMGQPPRSR